MQKDSIKNIIFDLGNVILNIDPLLSVKEMEKLGFKDFQKSYSLLSQSNLFDLLEKGEISSGNFYKEINIQLEGKKEDELIENAWNALLLDFPMDRIKLIQNLAKKYRLFLLSNTNEIHYRKYCNDFKKKFGFEFNSLFEKAYYSFELGMRKPDPEIFEKVLEDNNLSPFETLFVDDLDKNVDVAGRMGINVIWIDVLKKDDIVDKLHFL